MWALPKIIANSVDTGCLENMGTEHDGYFSKSFRGYKLS